MRNFLKRIIARWKMLDGTKFPADFVVELEEIDEEKKELLSKIRKEKLDKLHNERIEKQKNKKGLYLIALVQEKPVGYVYVSLEGTEKYHTSPVLQDLYVRMELREQKIGSKIIEKVESFLSKKGYVRASLDVEVKNGWIRHFYEKLGFELKSGPHLQSWREVDSDKKISIKTWYLEKDLVKN